MMRVRSLIPTLMVLGAALLVAAPSDAKDEPTTKAGGTKKGDGTKQGDGPSATDKETARGAMDHGDKLFANGDYEGALKSYEAADKIMGVTSTGLAVGKTLIKLGRLVKARDKLLAVTRIPKADSESKILTEARESARKLQDEVAGRIPSVTFKIEGVEPGSQVKIAIGEYTVPDAAVTLPQRVDPGEHEVTASCPGYGNVVVTVILIEQEDKTVTITFGPKTGPVVPSRGISPLVFIGFGTAGAGLLLGGITGGLSLSMASDIENACTGQTNCPEDQRSEADTANTLAHVSTAGFVLAGVGAGVGVVGLLMSDFGGGDDAGDPTKAPAEGITVQPVIGLGSVGLTGTF